MKLKHLFLVPVVVSTGTLAFFWYRYIWFGIQTSPADRLAWTLIAMVFSTVIAGAALHE